MGTKDGQIGPVSLDQLLALNDEIASLVRAGIPLDRGLTDWGREASGKLGTLAAQLSDRLRQGESLADIVAREHTAFPPVWRAVVLAGLRSGHLATALESLSHTSRRALELRRSIAYALIYPAIVVSLAFVLLVFSMVTLVPVLAETSQELLGRGSTIQMVASELAQWLPVWGWGIPLGLILWALWWWLGSGRLIRSYRGSGMRSRYMFRGYRPRASVRQTLIDGRMATFSEVLSMLEKHDIPLPEAIVLAADTSGDRALMGAARTLAKRVENGEKIQRREDLPRAFPPLLAWSVVAGLGRSGMQRALTTSAEMYRRRALDAARWNTLYLPMLLTVVFGGGAVLLQVTIVFVPFINMLHQLALPLAVR